MFFGLFLPTSNVLVSAIYSGGSARSRLFSPPNREKTINKETAPDGAPAFVHSREDGILFPSTDGASEHRHRPESSFEFETSSGPEHPKGPRRSFLPPPAPGLRGGSQGIERDRVEKEVLSHLEMHDVDDAVVGVVGGTSRRQREGVHSEVSHLEVPSWKATVPSWKAARDVDGAVVEGRARSSPVRKAKSENDF